MKSQSNSRLYNIPELLVALISLSPTAFISLVAIHSLYNDNIIYRNLYDLINPTNNLFSSYRDYSASSTVLEPFFFLVQYVGRFLSLNYEFFFSIKVFILILLLSLLISRFKLNSPFYVSFVLFFSTDPYLLVIASDIHRLSFLLISLCLLLVLRVDFHKSVLASSLFHIQGILFAFASLLTRLRTSRIMNYRFILPSLIAFSILAIFPFASYVKSKFYAYILLNYWNPLSYISASTYVFIFLFFFSKYLFRAYLSFYFLTLIISFAVGGSRLVFMPLYLVFFLIVSFARERDPSLLISPLPCFFLFSLSALATLPKYFSFSEQLLGHPLF